MSSWHELIGKDPSSLKWPYPIRYDVENEVTTDVLVLGGGIAGCWAAVSAARTGVKVALVEKAATIGSGAGIGCDHWQWAVKGVPGMKLSTEEFTSALVSNHGGYHNSIARYIQAEEGYETLLELEQMGGKIRDTHDIFKGSRFRDEATKFLFAYDYDSRLVFRVWGQGFKRALVNEMTKLGVRIFDRVMATSLLSAEGRQGAKVVGATGINVRTGEFYTFTSQATILAGARPQRIWAYCSELAGSADMRTASSVGGGYAMAWRAGVEFAMMEKTIEQGTVIHPSTAHGSGHPSNTWYPMTIVDAKGRVIPWVDRDGKVMDAFEGRTMPAPGQKFFIAGGGSSSLPHPGLYDYKQPRLQNVDELLAKGEIELPLYADLTSLPPDERRAIFGLMVGQEAKTKLTYENYAKAGFDPDQDMLMSYQQIIGGGAYGTSATGAKVVTGLPYIRNSSAGTAGGPMVDWNMRTNLEGLYAAGDGIFGGNDHSHAATTGRYAGRKAAQFAKRAKTGSISRSQVEFEKKRVYQPLNRKDGVCWKELLGGINKTMQTYCGDVKYENLLKMGLMMIDDLKEAVETDAFATDPHSLGSILGVIDLIPAAEMTIFASLARKASSIYLQFKRGEYPEQDPPDWHKFVTIRLSGEKVVNGDLPINYGTPYEENYKAHCGR
jgi:succinate dehydrogenase/fumarate reductase flavoprotein subunit